MRWKRTIEFKSLPIFPACPLPLDGPEVVGVGVAVAVAVAVGVAVGVAVFVKVSMALFKVSIFGLAGSWASQVCHRQHAWHVGWSGTVSSIVGVWRHRRIRASKRVSIIGLILAFPILKLTWLDRLEQPKNLSSQNFNNLSNVVDTTDTIRKKEFVL